MGSKIVISDFCRHGFCMQADDEDDEKMRNHIWIPSWAYCTNNKPYSFTVLRCFLCTGWHTCKQRKKKRRRRRRRRKRRTRKVKKRRKRRVSARLVSVAGGDGRG